MIPVAGSRSNTSSIPLPFPLPLFIFLALILISGLDADDHASTKGASATVTAENESNSGLGLKVLFVCLGLIAAVAFSVLFYKYWQKKKRAEQHARLLKLFEDDDELEVELGIRD